MGKKVEDYHVGKQVEDYYVGKQIEYRGRTRRNVQSADAGATMYLPLGGAGNKRCRKKTFAALFGILW